MIAALLKAKRHDLANHMAFTVTAADYNLDYIKKNLSMLDEFRLEEIERRIKAKDLEERLEVSVSERGEVLNTDMTVNLLDSIDDLVVQIQEKLKTGYGDIDFDAFNKLNSIVKWYYLRHKQGNTYTVSSGPGGASYFLDSLLNLLIYITTDKVESDLSRVHKMMEKEGLKDATYQDSFNITFMKVKIKKFKNNRIDIVFPKKEQAEKLQKILEAWHSKKSGR